MSEKASQFKIGIFVLAGLAILLAALFVFGLRSAFERMHHFETYVTGEVEGLSKGAAVKLRGVEVGKVTDVGFSWNIYPGASPNCVVIRFAIAESVSPIPVGTDIAPQLGGLVGKGLRAIVKTQAITGTASSRSNTSTPPRTLRFSSTGSPSTSTFPPRRASWDRSSPESSVPWPISRSSTWQDRLERRPDSAIGGRGAPEDPAVGRGWNLNNVNKVATDASATVLEVKELVSDARKTLRSMRLDNLSETGIGS